MTSPSASHTLLEVVVPVGPGDASWVRLLPFLRLLPSRSAVIFSATTPPTADAQALLQELSKVVPARWLIGPRGRARQMNLGARHAKGEFLWFLHADSSPAVETFGKLVEATEDKYPFLGFFGLAFKPPTTKLLKLNEVGVRLRSVFFQIPFGDQGFLIDRDTFFRCGAFNETISYGEDHEFVWRLRRRGIWIRFLGAPLYTSARKYEENGWLSTSLFHLKETAKQIVRFYAPKEET